MAQPPLVEQQVESNYIVLNVANVALTPEQFFQICCDNRDLRFELTAQKELIIMPLPGPDTSRRNAIIITALSNWAGKDGTGITFDSACRFILQNGANRGPDASWLSRKRWDALTPGEKRTGARLCPEFLVELMSPSDRMAEQKEKMEEYISNGLQLGWLIDPENKTVYIYRPGAAPEILNTPATLSGDPVLPGFVFNIAEIW
jgi:Uma2 family endonuclease